MTKVIRGRFEGGAEPSPAVCVNARGLSNSFGAKSGRSDAACIYLIKNDRMDLRCLGGVPEDGVW